MAGDDGYLSSAQAARGMLTHRDEMQVLAHLWFNQGAFSRAAQGKHRYLRQNVSMPISRASIARMASAPVRAFPLPLV